MAFQDGKGRYGCSGRTNADSIAHKWSLQQRFAGEGLLVSHYYTKEICQYFQQLLLAKFCG
jgi:hypothetical protein